MTAQQYLAILRSMGLTPKKPSYEGATIYADRTGEIYNIPDPDKMSEEERTAFIALFKSRTGLEESH